jgi:hypothetical protein
MKAPPTLVHFLDACGSVPCGVLSPNDWTFTLASVTCAECRQAVTDRERDPILGPARKIFR